MPDQKSVPPDYSQPKQLALSRWDDEGGAGPRGVQERITSGDGQFEGPQPANIELAQLRIRVIALENLVITLLAEVSDRQLVLAREMAAYISPRPGFTHHSVTVRAAAQMKNLVERAARFRVKTRS